MTDVTQEMILDYIVRKGGTVKNVDLVRHFRKHLQVDDPKLKDRAREAFKERVNSVAYIKAEKGDKYLHLRPEFKLKLTQPPTGRIPNGQRASVTSSDDPFAPPPSLNKKSVSSSEDPFAPPPSLNKRDSLLDGFTSSITSSPSRAPPSRVSPPKSSPSRSITNVKEPSSNSVAGLTSPKNSAVLSSYKPRNKSPTPPPSSSIYSPPSSSKPTSSMDFDLGGSDFGTSLLAELDSFGSFLGGTSGATTSTGGTSSSVSSTTNQTSLSGSNVSSSTRDSVSTLTSSPRHTGLSSSSAGDSSRSTGSSSVNNSTTSPKGSSYDQSRQTSQSSTAARKTSQTSSAAPSSLSSGPQTSDRASSGYGSLGKASESSSTANKTQPVSKPVTSSSLFDDIESMFSGLDSSISMALGDTSLSKSATETGPSKGTESSYTTSPPSPNKGTGSSYNSTPSPNKGTGSSHNSPPKTTSSADTTSYSSPLKATQSSPSTKATNSNSSPRRPAPGQVAPKPVRKSSLSTTSSDSTQHRPTSTTLTNGNADVKQVSNRRPPPGPSPVPKRPAPKPPTRTSSELKDKGSPSMTSTLGRHPQPSSTQDSYGTNTQSLGRHSHGVTNGIGSTDTAGGAAAAQRDRLGSFGLDFLNSFGSFASTAGTSLDIGTQPPPSTQPPPPTRSTPPPPTQSISAQPTRPTTSQHQRVQQRYSYASADESPSIRVESPTKMSDTSSYNERSSPLSATDSTHGRTSTYISLGPRPPSLDGSNERLTSGHRTHHDSNERIPTGVVLRNRLPSNAPAVRRSRNFDKNSNLENKTRQMIMATPPTARRSQHLAPPDVAPKPAHSSGEFPPARSREDVSQYGDEEGSGSIVGTSEPDYWDIDPYEKEWMLANAEAKMETIHRLFMTEPSLVNRKDFVHGYTAMHWAAKHGRCDLISALHMNGAMTNLKSNGGLTPLHLAAASGHDNAIQFLVQECKADVNARDHGGRRPVDMLNPTASEKTKAMLSNINNHGLPVPAMEWVGNLSSFSRPRSSSSLNRTWSSVGDIDRRHAIEGHKKARSPKSIRKSFSFKKTRVKEPTSPTKKEKKDKKHKKDKRPVSDAHAYSINRNWDV